MDLGRAVTGRGEGVLIMIRVHPSSRTGAIKRYDPWRDRLIVNVPAPPERGKANRALRSIFTSLFPETRIEIESGVTSRDKTVFVDGVILERALSVIGMEMEEQGRKG